MNDSRTHTITRVTLTGSLVNVLLSVGKLMAGIIGHSGAMVADAVHSCSDFATDLVVLVCTRFSRRPKDEDHDYGHGKFETLGSIIIGISLFMVAAGIIASAVKSIVAVCHGETMTPPGLIAIIAAAVSIVAKELLYQYTIRVGRMVDSPAMVANAWHHRSDAFSSMGTLVGISGAYLLGDRWIILDPIAAIAVGILIIKVSWDLVIPGMNELLDKSLPLKEEEEILGIITADPEVCCPHNLRTRQMGSMKIIDAHIRVDGRMTVHHSHALTVEIERTLKERYGSDTLVTIHVEPVK